MFVGHPELRVRQNDLHSCSIVHQKKERCFIYTVAGRNTILSNLQLD